MGVHLSRSTLVAVSQRITYKLCLTTWKTLHSLPLSLCSHYLPSRSLRSSETNLLTRLSDITSNFSSRAFSVSVPSRLPGTLYTCTHSFCRQGINLQTSTEIPSLPAHFHHVVILCKRLRFVLRFCRSTCSLAR